MALILIFTVIGFFSGFVYVLIKRRVRPANTLTLTFLSLLFLGIGKVVKEYLRRKRFF